MAQLPAHASPELPPATAPQPSRAVSDYHLHSQSTPAPSDTASDTAENPSSPFHLLHATSASGRPVPSFISPAVTPPTTPGGTALPASTPSGTALRPTGTQTPDLVEALPEVECIVRARIPTTSCHELFLHVYHNNVDNKEHLAIVFGNHIRSRSLDAPRPGETEMDRMIRGAYDGRLFPGRTTSRVDQLRREAGVAPSPATEDEQQLRRDAPLVRIHSECYTGETVWSARCDCGEQLDEAARQMSAPESGGGVIIYLRQEGRGIGLGEKLKAYNLQDLGNDTYEANLLLRHPADARSYGLATAMLCDLGLGGPEGIRLLTNNPDKVRAVEGPRREVVVRERVPMVPLSWTSEGKNGVQGPELEKYLSTKVCRPDTHARQQSQKTNSLQIEKFKHMLG
jgi:GTP cyclohydrolase II